MTMIEKVARAMRLAETDSIVKSAWEPGEREDFDAAWDDGDDADANIDRASIRAKWLGRARAAIEALLEPTPEMVERAKSVLNSISMDTDGSLTVRLVYQAFLAEALGDKGEPFITLQTKTAPAG